MRDTSETGPERAPGPLVSVVMSNYRGAPVLEAALASVLGQSHRHLEVIVADDASGDGSLGILHRAAAADPRVRPIGLAENRGPGGARNAALDAARGEWVAVVDSDDLIHPRRIERLLRAAGETGADMVADDLVQFGAPDSAGHTLLGSPAIEGVRRIGPADLLRSDTGNAGTRSLGYLKPLIRRDRLAGLRYDEELKIGEDFDLYLRLLLNGARFVVVPDPTYLYRRHAGSVSHRLSIGALQAQIAAHERATATAARQRPGDGDLRAALRDRATLLDRALRYERLVCAIKGRRAVRATLQLLRRPALAGDLRRSLADRRHRRRLAGEAGTGIAVAPARTLVLAAADRLAGIVAPEDAIRIAVPPMRYPAAPSGDTHAELASRLVALAAGGPIDVVAEGPEGLHAMGYLPDWRSAQLRLTEAAAQAGPVPPKAMLELLPQGASA